MCMHHELNTPTSIHQPELCVCEMCIPPDRSKLQQAELPVRARIAERPSRPNPDNWIRHASAAAIRWGHALFE